MLNDTSDFYRYFDATPQTEFLYGCVQRTIEQNLPDEAGFLKRYDALRNALNLIVDMPERLSDLLFQFLHQNGGTLSRRGPAECGLPGGPGIRSTSRTASARQ